MSDVFKKFIRPVLFRLDAERAHELGLRALQWGLAGSAGWSRTELAEIGEVFGPITRFGLRFPNPLGIAAGFDKNGTVVDRLAALGFGFVEVGTVTFEPQSGNPKPRLFRLPADEALINRLGFNNQGAEKIAERLRRIARRCIVGINIGRNRNVSNDEAPDNYLRTLETIHPVADYIAINVSSPNTPDLRELQTADNLEILVRALQDRNDQLGRKPLLVKIAPDLSESEIEAIVDTSLRLAINGIIATNTTIARSGSITRYAVQFGSGGLSGRPLAARSTEVVTKIYRASKGKLPIIGVGGIFTAEDAFDKIAAGASLVEAYTGFVYSGPRFAHDVVKGLAVILRDRGFGSLDEAVGSATR